MTEPRWLDLNASYRVQAAHHSPLASDARFGTILRVHPDAAELRPPRLLCFDNQDQPLRSPLTCLTPIPLVNCSLPVIEDALLVGEQMVFLQGDSILAESVGRHDRRLGLVDAPGGMHALSKRKKLALHRRRKVEGVQVHDGTALLLADPALHQYGTWLLKHAPKIGFIEHFGLPDSKVVVPVGVPSKHVDLIEALGVPRTHIVFQYPDEISQFERLAVPPKPYVFRRGLGGNPFRVFGVAESAPDTRQPRGRRLYVSRRGNPRRALRNEERVEDVFRAHGFDIVRPERLSVAETLGAFSNCSFVAGPSGSGLFNVLFARRTFSALMLVPPQQKFDGVHLMLCDICAGKGGSVGYIFGRMIDDRRQATGEALDYSWEIDEARLDGLLSNLVAER